MSRNTKRNSKENKKKREYSKPELKKHKPLKDIVLLTGATVGSSAASFGVV